jgi:hypothetical protein
MYWAGKYRSAIRPMIKGAAMAPMDWVKKATPTWVADVSRFFSRKVPRVTNQAPQIKNSRNIIKDNLKRIAAVMRWFLWYPGPDWRRPGFYGFAGRV